MLGSMIWICLMAADIARGNLTALEADSRSALAAGWKMDELKEVATQLYGADDHSWFSHLAIECNPKTNKNTWLEPVKD